MKKHTTIFTTSQIEDFQTPKQILPANINYNNIENISLEFSDGTPFNPFNLFAGFDGPNAEWIFENALTNAGMKVSKMKAYDRPDGSIASKNELCIYSFAKPNGNGGNKNLIVTVVYQALSE